MNNHKLFELLRKKRNKLAQENNVKPFMVLYNSVLKKKVR